MLVFFIYTLLFDTKIMIKTTILQYHPLYFYKLYKNKDKNIIICIYINI